MADAGRWLAELRSASRLVALYPDDHPSVEVAMARMVEVGSRLADDNDGEAVFSIVGDSVYLGREVLAHESLEQNALLRELQSRGIDSISLTGPTSRADALELAGFLASKSPDLPAGRSIRLNERPFGHDTLEEDAETGKSAGLRKAYVRGLDVLRGTAKALAAEQRFDLTGAAWVVESLVEQAVAQPAASILLSSMKSHDEYTFYHSVNVCILSIAMGRLIGMDDEQLRVMAIGGLLHDIGKVRVPADTLQFPGRLDQRRWAQIKLHPQEGAAAILAAAQPGQEIAAVVALEHHARYDGEGYPEIAKTLENGSSIHFFSRLVSTADTYDALTTRRSYRRAETPVGALEIMLQAAGGRYDPEMVQAFIGLVGLYPVGSILQTNDGSHFLVTAPQDDPARPILGLLVRTAAGELLDQPEPIALVPSAVARQLTASAAGIDPAALLESASVAWGES